MSDLIYRFNKGKRQDICPMCSCTFTAPIGLLPFFRESGEGACAVDGCETSTMRVAPVEGARVELELPEDDALHIHLRRGVALSGAPLVEHLEYGGLLHAEHWPVLSRVAAMIVKAHDIQAHLLLRGERAVLNLNAYVAADIQMHTGAAVTTYNLRDLF